MVRPICRAWSHTSGSTLGGRLSTTYQSRSSRLCAAVERPAPDIPVTTTSRSGLVGSSIVGSLVTCRLWPDRVGSMDSSPEDVARRYAWGESAVLITPDGAVAAVDHPRRGHSMLLEEDPDSPDAAFHEPARRWGKGFVIIDGAGFRFAHAEIHCPSSAVDLGHRRARSGAGNARI